MNKRSREEDPPLRLADLPTSAVLLGRLCAGGDRDAATLFATLYREPLLAFAQAKGFYAVDLEVAVHDTLRIASERLPRGRYDPAKGRFRDWLVGILRNRLRMGVRAACSRLRRERAYMAETLPLRAPPPCASDDAVWRKCCLRHALKLLLSDEALRGRTRAVFVDYVLAGRPAPEVAAAYGMAPNAVYQIKSRCLARLRALMRRMR